jgi:hypothetical protein
MTLATNVDSTSDPRAVIAFTGFRLIRLQVQDIGNAAVEETSDMENASISTLWGSKGERMDEMPSGLKSSGCVESDMTVGT